MRDHSDSQPAGGPAEALRRALGLPDRAPILLPLAAIAGAGALLAAG